MNNYFINPEYNLYGRKKGLKYLVTFKYKKFFTTIAIFALITINANGIYFLATDNTILESVEAKIKAINYETANVIEEKTVINKGKTNEVVNEKVTEENSNTKKVTSELTDKNLKEAKEEIVKKPIDEIVEPEEPIYTNPVVRPVPY